MIKGSQTKISFKKNDMNKYRNIIGSNTEINNMNDNKKRTELDMEISQWMKNIREAAKEALLEKELSHYIHPDNSYYLNISEKLYI